jgi:hypothetical protein
VGSQARARAALRAAQARLAERKPTVAVGYVHSNAGRVTSFEESLLALRDFDRDNAGVVALKLTVRMGTDGLPAARNQLATAFINSDCDWLLMVDTDMGFEPDSLYRLLEVAHPAERPIVGGLAFTQREISHDGMWGFRTVPTPTIFDWKMDPELGVPGHMALMMYPVNAPVQCAATGAAFILIHRSVFERIAQTLIPGTDVRIGPTWFDRTHGPTGGLMGEDISFCVRAALAEIPILVHTGVRTTHYKHRWLSEVDHWQSYKPGPATEEVAVIVPVLRRPQNAEPFMRSLRASTGLARAYAVADADDVDTIEAWRKAGAEVIVRDPVWEVANTLPNGDVPPRPGTFAEKVNAGYRATKEPWLFLTGDDVKFYPGWLDHAQHVGEILEADVVGANGLGNERELRGEHAAHLLIRRSYVDTVGASWDGPGAVTHEGYRHWFVDDEIVTAAKQRGKWQMALGAIVEHRHPLFGKGEEDEVYALGQASAENDRDLFRSRLAANS